MSHLSLITRAKETNVSIVCVCVCCNKVKNKKINTPLFIRNRQRWYAEYVRRKKNTVRLTRTLFNVAFKTARFVRGRELVAWLTNDSRMYFPASTCWGITKKNHVQREFVFCAKCAMITAECSTRSRVTTDSFPRATLMRVLLLYTTPFDIRSTSRKKSTKNRVASRV